MKANIYLLWNESTGTYKKITLPYTFRTFESYTSGKVRDRITYILDGLYNSKTNKFEFTVTRTREIVNTGTPSIKSWRLEEQYNGYSYSVTAGSNIVEKKIIKSSTLDCNSNTSSSSFSFETVYTFTYQDNTTQSGTSKATFKLEPFSNINYKKNGTWKKGFFWKKISGAWKRCKVFSKVNGTWKEGI